MKIAAAATHTLRDKYISLSDKDCFLFFFNTPKLCPFKLTITAILHAQNFNNLLFKNIYTD